VIEGGLRHLLVQDALELVEQRLALLAIQLAGLAAEGVVDLGQRAVGEASSRARRS
jgi:hypothetical protein